MAPSEPLCAERPLERLTPADLPGLLALSEEAGWNQTEDDWCHFLREGRVHGLRDAAGALIASGASLPYQGYGFVSMVLVTARERRRGHATRLLRRAVADLQEQDLVPVLDATPEGALVYGAEGFVPVFTFARYRRAGGEAGLSPRTGPDLAKIVALDAAACGGSRETLIRDFAGRAGTRICESATGFALARAGRRAVQLGPLVAETPAEALALLDACLEGASGPVFIDVPDMAEVFLANLGARGFVEARRFTRMTLGQGPGFGRAAQQFALAGPEFG